MTFALHFSDLCIEFFLLARDRTGGDDLHPHEEIAGFSAPPDSLAPDLQCGIVLDPGGYFKFNMALVNGLDRQLMFPVRPAQAISR